MFSPLSDSGVPVGQDSQYFVKVHQPPISGSLCSPAIYPADASGWDGCGFKGLTRHASARSPAPWRLGRVFRSPSKAFPNSLRAFPVVPLAFCVSVSCKRCCDHQDKTHLLISIECFRMGIPAPVKTISPWFSSECSDLLYLEKTR